MDSNITFTRRKWVTFALLFLCLFTLLQLVYQQLKGTAVSRSVVSVLAVLPSVAVINTLAPKEKVTAQINRLVSPRPDFRCSMAARARKPSFCFSPPCWPIAPAGSGPWWAWVFGDWTGLCAQHLPHLHPLFCPALLPQLV